jgi:uncharacterized protein YlxW (UPF0749 family)
MSTTQDLLAALREFSHGKEGTEKFRLSLEASSHAAHHNSLANELRALENDLSSFTSQTSLEKIAAA